MLDLGITNVMLFFVILGMCLIFIAAWIIKSESRLNICKNEMKKIRERLASSERDRFMLSERLESAGTAAASSKQNDDRQKSKEEANAKLLLQALEQNKELEKTNKTLKAELDEAKSSLEEVYKAMVSQG